MKNITQTIEAFKRSPIKSIDEMPAYIINITRNHLFSDKGESFLILLERCFQTFEGGSKLRKQYTSWKSSCAPWLMIVLSPQHKILKSTNPELFSSDLIEKLAFLSKRKGDISITSVGNDQIRNSHSEAMTEWEKLLPMKSH